ncbi:cytochrome P450 [Novosphingobium lentum]|uniref:cytochrome P450 n=1 Tax=Novosphingobium lentum TaxID=145287 RepID=UPI00082E8765|nr:cytochrome P450 [Novosphingobium lentum]
MTDPAPDPSTEPVLRPGPRGLKALVGRLVLAGLPLVFAVSRAIRPILKLPALPFGQKKPPQFIITRYDDVREVFQTDTAFGVPYKAKLDVIMGGEPVFVGMADTPLYRGDLARLREIVRGDDLAALALQSSAQAEHIVAGASGQLEVVDALVRRVTFDVLGAYIGIPHPPGGNLPVWCTRLFEFVFMPSDAQLIADVDRMAPAMRAHIDSELARRRSGGIEGDDLVARALRKQASGEPGWTDAWIRTALMGLIVGGPPQPPMVLPQALEQLLRRAKPLRDAQTAAKRADDALLLRILFEAMRFDPIAPMIPRTAIADWTLAAGTDRARAIPAGSTVMAAIQSAMVDTRRIPDPGTFDLMRLPHEYFLFGHGLHQCFGEHINRAMFPALMRPLLARSNLRRAPGKAGHLAKQGFFPSALTVLFDTAGQDNKPG